MKPRALLEPYTCTSCGKSFRVSIGSRRYRNNRKLFCGVTCRVAYSRGAASPNWCGGRHLDPCSGFVMLRLPAGTKGKAYRAEHRVVAEKQIGRSLSRAECVLHIDHDLQNNSPTNLYVCRSRKLLMQCNRGESSWPTTSNLSSYA